MINIVTINKNNLEGLRRTANSVLKQKDKNFKWLILDGNSNDGSVQFINEIEFKSLVVIVQDDEGIYHAMNNAIDYVEPNDLVWFLNSGDSLFDEMVVSEINNKNFTGDIIYGDFVMTDYQSVLPRSTKINAPEELSLLWLVKKTLNHQSYLIRGSLLKDHPFKLDYKVCADWVQFFSIIWTTREIRIERIKKILVHYEVGGFSNRHESQRLIERNRFLETMFSKKVLSDLNSIVSLVSKKNFYSLLYISKSKYRWRILSFIIRLMT